MKISVLLNWLSVLPLRFLGTPMFSETPAVKDVVIELGRHAELLCSSTSTSSGTQNNQNMLDHNFILQYTDGARIKISLLPAAEITFIVVSSSNMHRVCVWGTGTE